MLSDPLGGYLDLKRKYSAKVTPLVRILQGIEGASATSHPRIPQSNSFASSQVWLAATTGNGDSISISVAGHPTRKPKEMRRMAHQPTMVKVVPPRPRRQRCLPGETLVGVGADEAWSSPAQNVFEPGHIDLDGFVPLTRIDDYGTRRLLVLKVPIPSQRCGRERCRRAVVLRSVLARVTRSRRASSDRSRRP